MAKRGPLYPHVSKGSQITVSSPIELLKKWHQVIGEMLIDNDIDLEKYPSIRELHNETFRAIRG